MDGLGLNLTVLSNMDHMGFGFIAARELMPDLWDLAHCVPEALAELQKATSASNGSATRAPAKKAAAKSPPAKRSPATRTTAKRSTTKKAAAKRTTTKKSTTKRSGARR
jgi:hypothetical protein